MTTSSVIEFQDLPKELINWIETRIFNDTARLCIMSTDNNRNYNTIVVSSTKIIDVETDYISSILPGSGLADRIHYFHTQTTHFLKDILEIQEWALPRGYGDGKVESHRIRITLPGESKYLYYNFDPVIAKKFLEILYQFLPT